VEAKAITAAVIIFLLWIGWKWLVRSSSRREAKRYLRGKDTLVTGKVPANPRGVLTEKRRKELQYMATRATVAERAGETPDPADVRARNVLDKGGYR
jgi:hypothetical protein